MALTRAQSPTPADTQTPPQPAGMAGAARSTADLEAIVAQQQLLLSTQAVLVRSLEDRLKISPPGEAVPPPVGTDLQAVIDTNTAAIRTQAAYTNHLNDIVALMLPRATMQ